MRIHDNYDGEYKNRAIAIVNEIGMTAALKKLSVSKSTLRLWVKKDKQFWEQMK